MRLRLIRSLASPRAMIRRHQGQHGLTIIELLFAVAIVATIAGIALPVMADGLDAHRTASAARYVASRVHLARFEAVKRAADVGLRFEPSGDDYTFAAYADGNANGIRTLDIRRGIDVRLTAAERLSFNFADVRFGLIAGVPDIDGSAGSTDGLRIGAARILTLGSNGTATAGTLYIRGRRQQYAVRVLGITGRARVLRYHEGERRWISR